MNGDKYMILHKDVPLTAMEKQDLLLLIEDIKSYADQKHRELKAAGYPHAEVELSLPVADKSMQTRLNVKIAHVNPKSAKIDVRILTWKANGNIENCQLYYKDARHETFYEETSKNNNALRALANDSGLSLEAIKQSLDQIYSDINYDLDRV